jgi:hypothetical protein
VSQSKEMVFAGGIGPKRRRLDTASSSEDTSSQSTMVRSAGRARRHLEEPIIEELSGYESDDVADNE